MPGDYRREAEEVRNIHCLDVRLIPVGLPRGFEGQAWFAPEDEYNACGDHYYLMLYDRLRTRHFEKGGLKRLDKSG